MAEDKPIKHIDVRFEGVDDWGRPVFKDVDTIIRYGSVEVLMYGKSEKEIIEYFKERPDQLEYFGSGFNCEPHGGIPAHYRLNVVDDQSPQFLITGKDRAGKRFRISTNTPQHYNIWQGTLWRLRDGKRKKIKTYYN